MVPRGLFSRSSRYADWLIGSGLFLLTFAVYLRTLAPSVAEMFDDSLEFQLVAPRMAIAHPTGYPLFSILIKLFTFIPVGDIAYRVNLATALFGALAIPVLYAVARQLVNSRAAAVIAALIFAFGQTFWSQAVLAEVYTLQALLTAAMIWLTLRWGASIRLGTRTSLIPLAFFYGLMFTHHRMSALLLPALVVYVLSYDREFLREPRTLLRMAIAFILPLLLYLYIPLRGLVTSSLDGTYQNTPAGFINWVLGSGYNVFLTQNPFGEQREAAYYLDLYVHQFTFGGLALAAIGLVPLAHKRPREWLLLALALAANLAFALTYHVADINAFFIPSFFFAALFVAVGADWLVRLPSLVMTNKRLYAPMSVALLLLVFIVPYSLVETNFRAVDLSGKWDVHDYGLDVLSQPLPSNSTVVGILGEMTLLRYFQETEDLRRDVQTVAADQEPVRLSEIAKASKASRHVYLTRELPGAEMIYSFASFGPLLVVQPKPNKTTTPSPSRPLDEEFGGVKLIGYDLDLSRLTDSPTWHLATGRLVRVTLYWHVESKIPNDRFVSLKLLSATGTRGAQLDRRPVLGGYPTTAWRVGEFISDTYDLPVLVGAAPEDYTLQVTLYDPNTGEVDGQKDLTTVTLAPDTNAHPRESLDVDQKLLRDFGGMTLEGYSLDTREPYPAGASIPITLLWRATAATVEHNMKLRLVDSGNNAVASQAVQVGGASVRSGQYLRQEMGLALPVDLPSGPLAVELDYSSRSRLPCEFPFFTPCTLLGDVEVKK